MENIIEYKGYFTKVQYSAEDGILWGKIEGIADFVDFQCESAAEVEGAFREAVDDYLIFCEEMGKAPEKNYEGAFNVRIKPELHRAAAMEAEKQNLSLNAFVEKAIESYVKSESAGRRYFMPGSGDPLERASL